MLYVHYLSVYLFLRRSFVDAYLPKTFLERFGSGGANVIFEGGSERK